MPASILLDHLKRRGPRQGGVADDASLGDSKFIKNRGAWICEEMVADLVARQGAVKPLEERTSGNSERMLKIHLGAQRKEAHRDEDGGGEDVNVMAGEPGEELLKPLWLAMSRRR